VTSWNWLYLSDFSSSFKPVTLPDDNPSDFSYYFDISGRRTCYLAPERFLAPGVPADGNEQITWAMDVFSAGCVIAELFLEAPIFSLSQLYRYRRGEYDPAISHLSRIPDKDLREMISHMIHLNPEQRNTAEDTLQLYKGKIFPDYFYSFLHQYMELITDPSSGQAPVSGATKNLGEADDRIDRVYYDFDKISYFLGHRDDKEISKQKPPVLPRLGLRHFPLRLNIPNKEHYVLEDDSPPTSDDGILIFLTLIVASLRNTARATSKIRACDVLLAISERLTDNSKLDRVLPYLMALLNDKSELVVMTAVRTITQLVSMVKSVSPINVHVFMTYIIPRINILFFRPLEPAPSIVRATYASCLGTLALTALRYLEMAAPVKTDSSATKTDPEIESNDGLKAGLDDSLYDRARDELLEAIEAQTKTLIEDPDPSVRRAFLSSVPELCLVFGPSDTYDIIVTHLNTYLNDSDWMLKCAFFDTMVGLSVFLGSAALEAFILPLMIQALADPEEYVVQADLSALAELAGLGMFPKAMFLSLAEAIIRFTMHPNIWIREAAAHFLAAGTKHLSPVSRKVMLGPTVLPYLMPSALYNASEIETLRHLKKPLSRAVFDQSLNWALKSDRGVFWNPVKSLRGLAFGMSNPWTPNRLSTDQDAKPLSQIKRNDEDEQWLGRLRTLGLTKEDEFKFLALREFIWRLSRLKLRNTGAQDSSDAQLNNIIALRSLGITPQTVLFDEEPSRRPRDGIDGAPRSIEDALQDASMTIDDPLANRRRAALNTHRSRLNGRGDLSPVSIDGRRPLDEMITSPSHQVSSPTSSGQGSRRSSVGQGRPAVIEGAAATEAPYAARRGLRHQSSAMSLINRRESVKSGPETGTTDANAFGRVESRGTGSSAGRSPSLAPLGHQSLSETRSRVNHSYTGNDPNVLRMLDSMFVENYPHDVLDFGPLVTPISKRKAGKPGGSGSQAPWKPSGRVVTTFSEHTSPINRIVASPDHIFFLTGGEDGTVRVWDSQRLERNMSNRSRLTHRHATGARVLALCFIENTHTFVSCASDGSVHIVKVHVKTDVKSDALGAAPRYSLVEQLREYQLPDGEWAVWCEHYRHEANSVLMLATNRSRLLAIDLRHMSLMFVLENPVSHGTPTCFVVDRRRSWLVVGTSHGVLDLWDLRFRMRLKGWGVPGHSAIYRLSIHPVKGRGKWICVAGGTGQGEVTVWDLEKTSCREIYRVGGNRESPKGYEAWEVDEDARGSLLARYAANMEALEAPAAADRGVRAMVVGAGPDEAGQSRDVRHAYMLTGGSDKKIRFWDMGRIEHSCVVSGLGPDEGRPTFAASHITTAMTLNTERPAASKKASGSSRLPRSIVIAMSQQQLLKAHLDGILDMVLLEWPFTAVVSADRMGCVYVTE
jgi:phosphoinositide-3-kinase, regulatory subunit 4